MGDWNLTGKTNNIIKRLPHLFHAPGAGELLLRFIDLLGRRLEKGESDLYKVLRSRHVETADNEGSGGFTAADEKRGDLDKIFALYLEVVGGTSQLIKLKPEFTRGSMDFRRMARIIWDEDDLFIRFLKEKAFSIDTLNLLNSYHIDSCQVYPGDINARFVKWLLMGKNIPAKYLLADIKKNYPQVYRMAGTYRGGDQILSDSAHLLADYINDHLLKDPLFLPGAFSFFRDLNLPEHMKALIYSLYDRDYLVELYGKKKLADEETWKQALTKSVRFFKKSGEERVGAMDDLVRLNRYLLSGSLNHELLKCREIPSYEKVRDRLLKEFNALLDRDDLFTSSRFPDLVEDFPYFQKKYEKSWLNRILIEAAFPIIIEKSYVPYRERLRGILKILKEGASTRQGIRDIVAANLGIYGNSPEAKEAKALIDIEEFEPEKTNFHQGDLTFYQEFSIDNSNPRCEAPEITFKIKNVPRSDTDKNSPPLVLSNLKIIRKGINEPDFESRFNGTVRVDDEVIFKNNNVYVNGFLRGTCILPSIEEGESFWRFEAAINRERDDISEPGDFVVGRFDEPDSGLFDSPAPGYDYENIVFATDEPVVEITMDSYVLHPGIFSVEIPYHIPGFTDKFSETDDHPRHQLLGLVNKVKAAGVVARINYKQVFQEDQNLLDRLGEVKIEGPLFRQDQEQADKFEIESRQQEMEDQDLSDSLDLRARFDITGFDTLNKFD